MSNIFSYFTPHEINVISALLSSGALLVNIFVLLIAYKALSSWRHELLHADRNQIISLLFDDVKNLHAEFISLIGLQSKYIKLMKDADGDPIAHLRNDERYSDPDVLSAIEAAEFERIGNEFKVATEEYLQAYNRYTIKTISLSSYLISINNFPISKKTIDQITESINGLSSASNSCLEFIDNCTETENDINMKEIQKVNAKYVNLLVCLNGSKDKILNT
ncbi:hypothetical protein [Aeromonas dhakensis]|uniref:hypothetical protein n=1 Tax=Aeromonas dhakensis TaxID=196024 RepID=UPI003B9EAEA4